MIGKTLAHYEVLDKLGEGGMGAVYRARDTKLGREVALKVLPDRFAQDQERLARFHREARTLAALNHPNIAAIHGLESDQGVNFLAMELADGEDLSERLARGPLPVDEALAVAKAIAQGLEEAHARGIIHRDLKPANVKVSEDGKVKVLDFGLARAFEGESAVETDPLDSPTLTAAMTGAGVILGTAAYMSPEQARGAAVDRRSDIWSFGVLLYEMLTAKRLFQGDTVSDTLAGILKTDPDWDALPADTPDAVRLLLARCLERDLSRRLQDIGEARILLSDDGLQTLYSSLSLVRPATLAEPTPGGGRGRPLLFAVMGVALGAALGIATLRALTPAAPPPPARYLEVALPQDTEEPATAPQISPDGTMAVYERADRLWLRRFDTGATLALPGTEGGDLPFWSPDSRQVGFFEGSRIVRIEVDGGAPVTVSDLDGGDRGAGGCWAPDDHILFTLGDDKGVLQVPARGGVPSTFMAPDTSLVQDIHDPFLLPDGQGLIYSAHLDGASYTQLHHFRDGEWNLVFDGVEDMITNPVWCASGHILFRKDGPNAGVWAIPYDPAARAATGDPFLVVGEGLWPSIAADGTLLCATGDGVRTWQVTRLDREGDVLATYGEPQDMLPFFSLDPRGERIVLTITEDNTNQLWMLDLNRGTQSRLTFDERHYAAPVWTSDGRFVVAAAGDQPSPASFAMDRISVEGLVPMQSLAAGHFQTLTPDDRTLVFTRYTADRSWDLFAQDLTAPASDMSGVDVAGEARVLADNPGWQYGAQVSPDGRLVAYVSRETGRDEVYLRRFPEGDQKRQVSRDGGGWPQWNAAGDRLFYMSGLDLVEVPVEVDPTLRLGAPQTLFTRPRGADVIGAGWPLYLQVDGDGDSFFMLLEADRESGARPLLVVQNWASE